MFPYDRRRWQNFLRSAMVCDHMETSLSPSRRHGLTHPCLIVEIPGYQVYRLYRLGKAGAGVCAYVKCTLKVKILKDLTEISESGLHQLWIQVQNKKLCSLLVSVVYRSPEIGNPCLENELLQMYIEALSRNKDIVLTTDLNCDLLSNNPRGEALLSFCVFVNATQLMHK